MTPVADAPLSGTIPPAAPVRFVDRGGLFGLLVKNAVLTFLTVGIYRFWARAALRRYWWGSIVIAGDPLEYTGTGLELFVGFLMFLGIMLPFGLVYGLTALLAASNPLTGGLLRLVEVFLFLMLIQIVTFRARRYRLSRTLWRGVRASQGGSSWEYLLLVFKWTLLSVITLGITVPWARIATTRYLMDRTALGDLEARFDGRGHHLVLPWIAPFVLLYGAFGVFLALNIDQIGKFGPGVVPRGIWLVVLGYVGAAVGFLVYLLIELRYTARHTRFGEVQLGSALPIGGIVLTIFGFLIVAMLVLFGFGLFAGLIIWLTGGGGAHAAGATAMPSFASVIPAIVIVLIGSLFIGVLRILWVDRSIVRRLCDTMSLTNVDRLDRIGQSTAPIPSAGEGMADAFDIGAF